MSKFRYPTIACWSVGWSVLTYWSEPSSPSSSALQNANRTVASSSRPSAETCRATSRIVAVPDPLSLMPGPSITESRCPPTMSTRDGSPAGVSARRLVVVAVTLRAFTARWTSRSAAPAASTSAEAALADTDTAGIDTPTGPRSVGLRMWSGSAPGYATIRALAPAACAFSSWSRRKHWPGCTSATSPAETRRSPTPSTRRHFGRPVARRDRRRPR